MDTTNSHKAELMRRLGEEIRAGQRATDAVDEAVTELFGVNRTDSRCLDILEQHGRMTAGHLAALSGLSTGAVTAVVDRLERAGYAQRVPDPSDRRRVLVELTERAQTLIWELMGRPLREAARPVMEAYSDAELELLLEFHRQAREFQERHAQWLREQTLKARPATADAMAQKDAIRAKP
ncbi:MAG TPA: MarR family transcriptional regulator [Solirubrobacteraceae bacterium]